MSQTVLLINPWIHDFSAYDLWIKPVGLPRLEMFITDRAIKLRIFYYAWCLISNGAYSTSARFWKDTATRLNSLIASSVILKTNHSVAVNDPAR